MSLFVAGSREYLKRHGTPKSPEDLAQWDCIAVGSQNSWVLRGPNGKVDVPARIVARYRSMAGVAHAVAAGIGLAALPRIFSRIRSSGTSWSRSSGSPVRAGYLYLVYVSRRNAPLKIRSFIDFFLENVAHEEEPAPAAVA